MKQLNKKLLAISLVIILLPSIFGAIMWNKLADEIAIHWGITGEADGFADPLFVVVFLPLLFAVMQIVGIIVTHRDNKDTDQSPKIMSMVYFILPTVSVYASGIIYATALGFDLYLMPFAVSILLGAVFMVIGNYMPKCTRNRTVGIKTRLTMSSDANWNATHRFAGKLYVICGVLMLLTALLPTSFFMWSLILLLLVTVIPPLVYSELYYRKELREGTITKDALKPNSKTEAIISISIVVILCAVIGTIMLTGNITYTVTADSVTADAPFYSKHTIPFDKIDSIEYIENGESASRIAGFASLRLALGLYHSETLGKHTRYTYLASDATIVIRSLDTVIVLNAETAEETQALYQSILAAKEAN